MNQIFLNGITLKQLAIALQPLLHNPSTKQLQQAGDELLTRNQVCELLSFNKTTLWKHTKSGKLHSFGIGNRVYYKRSQVLEAVKPINH